MVLHLQPKRPVMVKAPLSLNREWFQVCSRPVYCAICDVTLEAIGSSPEEAERRAIAMYSEHCKRFHVEH